jgi:hypothetical protein
MDEVEERGLNSSYVNKLLLDSEINKENKNLEKCNLYCSTSKGQVLVYDIMIVLVGY